MRSIVILPTYNEKENIEKIANGILEIDDRIRILIVDDNSPDGTGIIADKLADTHKNRIKVLHRRVRGRGSAGIEGFQYALKQDVDCIIEMDADFSHNPSYIPDFIHNIKHYDIVIGSRFVKGGGIIYRNTIRNVISIGARILTRIILGPHIRDWSGGFKCYRKSILASLDFDNFYSKGYSVGMEMFYELIRKGYSFTEIPYVFSDRKGGSSKFNMTEIISYIIVLLKLKIAKSQKRNFGEVKLTNQQTR